MKKTDFNNGWSCRPYGSETEALPVTLPHDAMRTEERVETSLGEGNIGWFAGGDYEYRKLFCLEDDWKGKDLLLEFESVYHNAEVWINGQKAAFRPYGYTNFFVELNPWINQEEENEIVVIARNADQPNSRWYSGTGIFRPVWLYTGGGRYIRAAGIKIRTLSIRPARIGVKIETSTSGTVQIEILDSNSGVVACAQAESDGTASVEMEIPGAQLWSPDTPVLYTARVRFGDDEVLERFGIRSLTWDPQKGIALNGERIVLLGACIHHDNGILGACTYPEVEHRRVRILKESGYNAIRSAHNPCSRYLLDACDELGVLMADEYVDCWYMHKTEHDYASYVEEWWRQDLKDMVDKDYNHPCVIMYSTGNEVAETAQKRGVQLQAAFTEYLHGLDPTRPVTCGINIFFNFLSSMGMGVYSDEKAKKQAEAAARAAAMADTGAGSSKPKKRHVGSEFYNVLAAKLGCDFMKFGASLPPCDWKTRDAYAVMDIAGYNYGNWRYRHDAKKYPQRLILGSETLIGDAYDFWEIAKEVPQVVGDFVWAGWDYTGECGDGGPEFTDYWSAMPQDRLRGGSCRIDVTGKKTPEVDYTRVAFELEKGPFLAVFPVYEEEKPSISGWQLTRAIRSWTWPGCDGRETDVEVHARAASVELFVNGSSVGKKKPKKGRAIFRTAYHDGELLAVAYDRDGHETGRDRLMTAGAGTKLVLEAETSECRPGEMVYFRMRYTDDLGEIKPMEKHRIRVSTENGTLMGTVNASAYFAGNFAQEEVPSYFGEAQAIVQAGEAGMLRVTASDGERTAEVQILCRT